MQKREELVRLMCNIAQYQEIFAISQALPGPASTKMLFCINYLHGGRLSGFGAFLFWW